MNDFIIFTDAGCDLPTDMQNEMGIQCVPMEVTVEGDSVSRSSDSIAPKDIYDLMRAGKTAKTSAVNLENAKAKMVPFLEKGLDILYIAFSSALSSSYNAARLACDELSAEYTERKLIAVDTLAASLGQGLLVYKVAQLKQKGEGIEQIAKWVEDNKMNMCHLFTVDDLVYLKRGGRVSATTAVVGQMLGIKPVLHVNDEGRLVSVTKVRGRKAALQELVNMMKKTAFKNTDDEVFISHGDCLGDAEILSGLIKTQLGFNNITIGEIGPTIGSHAGPGTIALFFFGSTR